MHTRSRPRADEPDATEDGGIVEREVETVRTREHVAGAAVDVALPDSRAALSERRVGYFELLPERLRAVGLVARTAIVGLLGIRFLLLASGADTNSTFGGLIEDVSWFFARPFANVFSNRSLGSAVIEASTLVAMIVYFLLFALLGTLVAALAPRLSRVPGRRRVTTFRASTAVPESSPLLDGGERHRPSRPIAATDDVPRHRRLLRLARARKS